MIPWSKKVKGEGKSQREVARPRPPGWPQTEHRGPAAALVAMLAIPENWPELAKGEDITPKAAEL